MKKNIFGILSLIFCLLFAGCGAVTDTILPPQESSSSSEPTASAPEENEEAVYRFYYDSGDSFHPFLAKTQTQYQLFPLLYDGLIKVSPEHTVEYRIAASAETKGKLCRVQLGDAVFSDGSAITAKDVVDSFEQAKREGSLYAEQLKNAERCEAEGDAVIFYLKEPNRFFVYNLDFPILKSAESSSLPIGCGRYVLQKNGNAYRMVQNESYPCESSLPEVVLTVLKNNESMLYAVKTGAITAYAEDAKDKAAATIGTWTASVSMNHLVFLGLNPEHDILSDSAVRKAILLAVDSSAVLTQAYGSQGVTAAVPLNPWLTDGLAYDFSGWELYHPDQAKTLLEDAGYRATDSSVRRNEQGQSLSVRILVNKNNSSRYSAAYLISGMLESVGFSVQIEKVGFDEYERRIASGDFDLYIGETRQPLDGTLDVFLTGDASYGLGKEGTLSFSAAAGEFLRAEKGEKAFFDAIFEEVPMIPLLYRNGVMIYSKSIENKVITAPHDMFYNIEAWQ